MKTLLLILTLLIPLTAWSEEVQLARLSPLMVGGGVATAATTCTLYADGLTGTAAAWNKIGYSTTYHNAGLSAFTPASGTVTICKVIFLVDSAGDPSGITYVAKVWSMSGNNLNAVLGTSNDVSGISGSDQSVSFTFASSVSVDAGTNYAITIDRKDGSYDTTNYIIPHRSNVGVDNITGIIRLWGSNKASQDSASADCQVEIWTDQ